MTANFESKNMIIGNTMFHKIILIWNNIMAANTILVVPVIIVFLFASKKIISAFAYRGMK